MTTEEAALAADLLAAAVGRCLAGIWVMPLPSPDSSRPLWVAYIYGMRNYDLDPAVLHFVAVYTRQNDAWQEIDRLSLDARPSTARPRATSSPPTIVGQGDVQVVALGDDNLRPVDPGQRRRRRAQRRLPIVAIRRHQAQHGNTLPCPPPRLGRVADINADRPERGGGWIPPIPTYSATPAACAT
jgi:hypothetical protein